ncbi:MAG: class I SAM-dependent methyltransferase [Planctomycetota bacterium]
MSNLDERLERLAELGGAAWDHWIHLREAFPDPRGPEYWAWLNTHGRRDLDGIAALLPPIPPAEIYRFSNTTNDWGYLLTAASTYQMVMKILADLGLTLGEVSRVLDFGCGPGRGLRCFIRHVNEAEFFGCDVDRDAIEWCRKEMPFGSYEVNAELPRTVYEDDQFDLVFSVSVFSHLSERSQTAWLEELARIMRPGGHAILTMHGLHALERARNEQMMFDMIEVDRDLFEAAAKKVLEERGFGFIPQAGGHLTNDLYGVSFIHPDYVAELYSRHFDIVEHRVADIDNWQDAVVLRAR